MNSMFRLATCVAMLLILSLSGSGRESGYRLRNWAWWVHETVNSMVIDVPVVAVGELISMREAAGIKVRSSPLMYSTDRSQIMTIRVHSVLKGKSLVVPGSIVEALVVPEGTGCLVIVRNEAVGELPPSTFAEAYEKYQQTGQWPSYWGYPKIPPNELQIFFLDKVRERDPRVDESSGVTEVTGITRYHLGKHFYVYAWSLEAKPEVLSIVKRYAEINDIRDVERREQELLKFSLFLIEDHNTSEPFAFYSAIDLRNIVAFARKPAVARLTDNQIEKLIAVATDRSRSKELRNHIGLTLEAAHKYAGRKINVEPFLRVIADSQDDEYVRYNFTYFLERLNTPEVREGFKKILQREPRTEEDKGVWQELSRSKILKGEREQQ